MGAVFNRVNNSMRIAGMGTFLDAKFRFARGHKGYNILRGIFLSHRYRSMISGKIKKSVNCVSKGEFRLRNLSEGIVVQIVGLDIAAVDRQ